MDRKISDNLRQGLQVEGLTKLYPSGDGIAGVSLELKPGSVHGLIGHNGAGKSTLISVLTGALAADKGQVTVGGQTLDLATRAARRSLRSRVAVVHQELSIVPHLSVYENLVCATHHRVRSNSNDLEAMRRALERTGLGSLPLRTPASSLGVAERQLVEISRALYSEASVVALDEPTAALKEAMSQRVMTVIRDLAHGGSSVLLVSHRLPELLAECDELTVLRDGASVAEGPVAEFDEPRLVELVGGTPTKPAMVRTADAVAVEGDIAPGDPVLTIEGLLAGALVEPMTFDLRAGDVLGVVGQVGSGAEDILTCLAGLQPPSAGRVSIDGREANVADRRRSLRSGFTYLPRERKRDGVFLEQSLTTNLTANRLREVLRLGFLAPSRERKKAIELMEQFTVRASGPEALAQELSGGNQQKVALARTITSIGRVLLLNEPTRGVDVGAKQEILTLIRQICEAQGCVAVVTSTEVSDMMAVSDRVVVIYAGRTVLDEPTSRIDEHQLLAATLGAVHD